MKLMRFGWLCSIYLRLQNHWISFVPFGVNRGIFSINQVLLCSKMCADWNVDVPRNWGLENADM